MNKILLTLGAALLLADASWAVKPSRDAINACLTLSASGDATYDKLDISEFQSEDHSNRGYQATLCSDKGQRIGYAEKSGKDDALIWSRWLLPLASAKALNDQKDEPSAFTPMLAMWGYVHDGKQRLLCVNFNFDGIGRSGSFQKVHGLYLMPTRTSKKTKPDLYYGVLSDALEDSLDPAATVFDGYEAYYGTLPNRLFRDKGTAVQPYSLEGDDVARHEWHGMAAGRQQRIDVRDGHSNTQRPSAI